ncbi:MAG: cytochrome C [Arcobacteraceae bacterium]|nr:cytochrome C [Arcobacteraceae bacterium]
MKIILIIFIFILNLYSSTYKSLLFHGNCTTCHFELKTVSAPAVINFQKQYKIAFPKKEDFVNYMARWVQHPNPETSLMDGAIKKHGLMPELGFDLDTLKQISEYIYDTDFTKPHEHYN